MQNESRPLAVVTGASSDIGLELARKCAENGYDLLLVADRPLREALRGVQGFNVSAEALLLDLSNFAGVEVMCAALRGRAVDVLIVNAAHEAGKAFLDQDIRDAQHVVDANVIGTLLLIHRIGSQMRRAGKGKILIAGSVASFTPDSCQALHKGTRAFIYSFARALGHELADTGVTVTCLMPGATGTEIFERGMDPAKVAKGGFKPIVSGERELLSGWSKNIDRSISSGY